MSAEALMLIEKRLSSLIFKYITEPRLPEALGNPTQRDLEFDAVLVALETIARNPDYPLESLKRVLNVSANQLPV